MRSLSLLLVSFILLGCNEKIETEPEVKEIPFAQADTRSNDVVHMSDLNGMYKSLDEVIAANKGKVVYMDIWASWCGPCKAQFPASHKLQEKYRDQNVTFLYVSIDRNEEAWKYAVNQFNLKSDSYLARNYPKARLFQSNNVSTIPRYMIFDKTGRLVVSDASRPSASRSSELIDAFLKI